MRTGLMAKKLGMTRVFDQNRKHNSVTVLEIPSAKVLKSRKKKLMVIMLLLWVLIK